MYNPRTAETTGENEEKGTSEDQKERRITVTYPSVRLRREVQRRAESGHVSESAMLMILLQRGLKWDNDQRDRVQFRALQSEVRRMEADLRRMRAQIGAAGGV